MKHTLLENLAAEFWALLSKPYSEIAVRRFAMHVEYCLGDCVFGRTLIEILRDEDQHQCFGLEIREA